MKAVIGRKGGRRKQMRKEGELNVGERDRARKRVDDCFSSDKAVWRSLPQPGVYLRSCSGIKDLVMGLSDVRIHVTGVPYPAAIALWQP